MITSCQIVWKRYIDNNKLNYISITITASVDGCYHDLSKAGVDKLKPISTVCATYENGYKLPNMLLFWMANLRIPQTFATQHNKYSPHPNLLTRQMQKHTEKSSICSLMLALYVYKIKSWEANVGHSFSLSESLCEGITWTFYNAFKVFLINTELN